MVRSTKILEIIEEENLLENVQTVGEYLMNKLHSLSESSTLISNVRGKGLLCAFDFPNGDIRNKFVELAMEKGGMFLGCGDKSIRFRPALNITTTEIDAGIRIIESVLPELV